MYLEHFGLREPPFRITPHTDFFFDGANRGATLDALIYAITHDEGIVKVSGEVGSGKTMLCRVLMERLPANVTLIYLANPSLSREDILYAIADELCLPIPENARLTQVLRSLQEHLIESYSEGRRVVVLIDEAHAMPVETLEEIRLLSNLEANRHKLLQLVLFGQPELNDILARPDMRQLKERITHNFGLEPLVRDDIANYLDFRMRAAGYHGPGIFSAAAVKLVEQASQGLTRRINILADKALLAAFSAGTHEIGAKEAQAAIRDCDFSTVTYGGRSTRKKLPVKPLIAGGILALAVLATMSWQASEMHPAIPASAVQPTPISTVPLAAAQNSPAANPLAITPKAVVEPPPAQISATPAPPAAQPTSQRVVAAPPTDARNDDSKPAVKLPPLTQSRLEAGRLWLAQAPDDHWFIQLFATDANRREELYAYLRRAKASGIDLENLRIYASSLSGRPRYGVIYGEYPTRTATLAAIAHLPAPLRTNQPYPRQVIRLR